VEDAAAVTRIRTRQNTPEALCAARAFRRRYTLASWNYSLRIGGGLLIGIAGIAFALAGGRASGDYVAAVAAAWLFVGRLGLQRQEEHLRREGALGQEVFDTKVFALPWNAAKVGEEPAPEDLRSWGKRQSDAELRDWYPDTQSAPRPLDALLCQRSTVAWARQDHATWARIARGAVVGGLVLTVVLGLALHLGLGEYLLRLGLPVLPLALDLLDVADENAEIAALKLRTERRGTELYVRARDAAIMPTIADCRQIQDEIFATRLLPGVPGPFYRFTRKGRQQNMEEIAAEQARALPSQVKVSGASA
jgi:hypothetical protein